MSAALNLGEFEQLVLLAILRLGDGAYGVTIRAELAERGGRTVAPGALYTALADAAFLSGFALWRLRRRIQRKPDTDPPHMLADAFRNSVFMTGFKLRDVDNPALRGK